MENYENLVMEIIAFSGESKGFTYQALELSRAGEFEKAEELLKKAKESLVTANKSTFTLLAAEANDDFKVTLLMVHAFDHLANAENALDNAQQLISTIKLIPNSKN